MKVRRPSVTSTSDQITRKEASKIWQIGGRVLSSSEKLATWKVATLKPMVGFKITNLGDGPGLDGLRLPSNHVSTRRLDFHGILNPLATNSLE